MPIPFAWIRRTWASAKARTRHRLADLFVSMATFEAARKLRKSGPITVLIDNSTIAHGVTHETAWISTGTKMWGNIPFESGYSARIPVHSHTNDSNNYREITYLIGLAHLARLGLIKLVRSKELHAESIRHPSGMFAGYGWHDLSVFKGIGIGNLNDGDGYFNIFGGLESPF